MKINANTVENWLHVRGLRIVKHRLLKGFAVMGTSPTIRVSPDAFFIVGREFESRKQMAKFILENHKEIAK